MSWTRSGLAVTCLAVALGLGWPGPACASGGWEWPVDGAVSLGYGARYTSAQGVASTHGGLDVGAPAGATVRACVGGEVTFSGLIPAGEGERAWAVTVLTADGLRVTYLPLERGSVSKGAAVRTGASLGEVAGTGDASSSAPHLHLGVRRGETRLDPLAFLVERQAGTAAPVAPSAPAPRPASPAVLVAPPVTAPSAALSHAMASAPQPSHASATVPGVSSLPVPARGPITEPAPLAPTPSVPLPSMPTLARVPSVAETPRVRASTVAADLTAARDLLAKALGCLGLAGVAGACTWPVLRRVLDGGAGTEPATVPVRADRA